jgi:hypothetical protein
VRYYIVLSEESFEPTFSSELTTSQLYCELNSMYPNSYWLQIQSISNSSDNEEVFSDKTLSYDGVDGPLVNNYNIESGDPLGIAMDTKHVVSNNNKRHSSGSDQSTNNTSQQSISETTNKFISLPNKSIIDSMSTIIEIMIREFISKSLIPWAEKQIKLLGESISQRKGFRRSIFSATKSLINNMSSSTVGLKAGSMSQSVIYLTEAPEMQQRKLGDISMSLTMYELAFNSYYAAKKDFQSEGAWLYYAGASEASAIASYYTNKFQKHYFDQAINCYVETCKAMNYATRTTILATEAIRKLWPNDAANLFIRMTGDDSDLRSALFLEQASKCFIAAGSRLRKSAFHYVLAGHRYNRCGLKQFALSCYRRFNCCHWNCAADHVNLTIARLYLSIANSAVVSNKRYLDYKNNGLEIMRANANKQIFYQEFIREIKKDLENSANNVSNSFYLLDIPFIFSVIFEPIEGSLQHKHLNTCFVNEEIIFKLCVLSPFQLVLHQLKFYTNNMNAICNTITSTLESNEETVIYLTVIPQIECDFEILGIEYKVDDSVLIKCEISDKIRKSLMFRSIKTLPLIEIDIGFPSLSDSILGSTQVYSNEIIELFIRLTCNQNGFKPSNMIMTTNANIIKDFIDDKCETDIEVAFDSSNTFKIQIPSQTGLHSLYFKLRYTEDNSRKSRTLTKTIDFNVNECLHLESMVEGVASLKNLLINESVFVNTFGNQTIEIPATLTAHVLVDGLSIPWSLSNRHGLIQLY